MVLLGMIRDFLASSFACIYLIFFMHKYFKIGKNTMLWIVSFIFPIVMSSNGMIIFNGFNMLTITIPMLIVYCALQGMFLEHVLQIDDED